MNINMDGVIELLEQHRRESSMAGYRCATQRCEEAIEFLYSGAGPIEPQEYKMHPAPFYEHMNSIDSGKSIGVMNDFGKDGWIFIEFVDMQMIFRRPKQ